MGKKSREKRERRENPPFHITVAATMVEGDSSGGDKVQAQVSHHIRLVKASLLYADKVTLCSPFLHFLLAFERMGRFSMRERAELMRLVLPTLLEEQDKAPDIETLLLFVDAIIGQKQLPKQLRPMQRELEAFLNQMFEGWRELGQETSRSYGLDELSVLLKTGRVEVKRLGSRTSDVEMVAGSVQSAAHLNQILETGQTRGEKLPYNDRPSQDKIISDLLDELQTTINSPKTYPLFDDFTGNLVRLGLSEGRIEATNLQTNRAKHIGLAASLLEKLPLFDEATVDELIDIQQELQRPLVNFRRALINFSGDMASAPWDVDFTIEVEKVFRTEVEPIVLEIEEQVNSNKYLFEISRRMVKNPFMVTGTGSALAIALSNMGGFGDLVVSSLGIGTSAAVLFGDAWRQYVEEKKKIEGNQLFFYYKAGQRLKDV